MFDIGSRLLGGEKKASHPYSRLTRGVPKAGIVEFCGPTGGGETEFLIQFLVENPHLQVAWLEERFSVYPCGLANRGLSLERILFIEAARDLLWSSLQVLRSQLFSVVVLSGASLCQGKQTEQNLRRLQLDAKQSGTTIIFLQEDATKQGGWPIQLQIEIRRNFSPSELRYYYPSEWIPKGETAQGYLSQSLPAYFLDFI